MPVASLSHAPTRRPGVRLAYLHGAAAPHAGTAEDTPQSLLRLAREIERAGFDLLLFDDLPRLPDRAGAAGRLDPFTAASFVATGTQRLGLAVTADPAYYAPFNLARLTASLDHISHGRAAWNLVVDPGHPARVNYGVQGCPPVDDHWGRAREFLAVVRALWDSWEDDAFIRDKASGAFVDGARIHVPGHAGPYYQVQGPLNVARPPQGQVPLVHAEHTPASREWAAAEADVVLLSPLGLEAARAARAELRGHARAAGRPAGALTVLARVVPVVGATVDEARAALDRLHGRLPPGDVLAGTASDIADRLAEWLARAAADGFAIQPVADADQWPRFAELVVPELARRGLHTPPAAATLRANLGLARPRNRHAS